MTQRPFSRPGAIDLSALKRPAAGSARAGVGSPASGPPGASGPAGAGAPTGASYWLVVTEENFQATVEASVSAPVLLVFFSPSRLPESERMARDLAQVAEEYEGRFLAGLVDIDTTPSIAQAVQLPSVPYVFALLDGRPAPLIQDVLKLDDLRAVVNQVMQQLTAQGMTGRHQPRPVGAPAGAEAEGDDDAAEPPRDPRYAPAEEALERGDFAAAVAEYEKLVRANPADVEAAGGLAMASVLHRTADVDEAAARASAQAGPADVDAQTLVADLDLLAGRVDEAFSRLVELVRRTTDADRNRAREHLIGLFAAVGNDDDRVLTARRDLASALF